MRRRMAWGLSRLVLAISVFGLGTNGVAADGCEERELLGASYVVCAVDPLTDDLRLFWRDSDGQPFRTFDALSRTLRDKGRTLVFAMNGGMYETDFSPVGLHIENEDVLSPLNTKTVTGRPSQIPNFYKKPNGVFFWGEGLPQVLESERFRARAPKTTFATQSGPMLVIDGEIHPAFIEKSRDFKRRNGVGVAEDGTVYLVISKRSVSFYDFARAFRDGLGVQNALFLDGGWAPGIYAPQLGRNDWPGHGGYGPIIAVVR